MSKIIITRPNCLYNKYPEYWKGKMNSIEKFEFDEEPNNIIKKRIIDNLCPKCGSRLIWNDQICDKLAGYGCENYPFTCKYVGLSFRLNPSWYLDNDPPLPPPDNFFYL